MERREFQCVGHVGQRQGHCVRRVRRASGASGDVGRVGRRRARRARRATQYLMCSAKQTNEI